MLTGPEGWLVVVSLIWLVPGGDSGGRAGVILMGGEGLRYGMWNGRVVGRARGFCRRVALNFWPRRQPLFVPVLMFFLFLFLKVFQRERELRNRERKRW